MKVHTANRGTVTISRPFSQRERQRAEFVHGNKYDLDSMYRIEGERAKVDVLIKCDKHGWVVMRKDSLLYKRSGCPVCAEESRSERAKQIALEIKSGRPKKVKKHCEFCGKAFFVENTAMKRRKRLCSTECLNKKKSYTWSNFTLEERRERAKKISNSLKEKFRTGALTVNENTGRTKWLNYKDIKVQGTYEYAMCQALDILLQSEQIYAWEYTNDRIVYRDINFTERTYLPDFKVYLTQDMFFYLETKGYATDNDVLKWQGVISQGMPIKVFFQCEISSEELVRNPSVVLNAKFFDYKEVLSNRIKSLVLRKFSSKASA